MKKTLKFAPELLSLVLSGEKTSTWRLWDDKNLSEGDIVEFVSSETKEMFATVRLTRVIERNMGEMTEDEQKGHEKFSSEHEKYAWYTKYYKKPVTPATPVKIILFEVIQ